MKWGKVSKGEELLSLFVSILEIWNRKTRKAWTIMGKKTRRITVIGRVLTLKLELTEKIIKNQSQHRQMSSLNLYRQSLMIRVKMFRA